MKLFFDTETTGKPNSYSAPSYIVDNWPRMVQLGWILENDGFYMGNEFIVRPDGYRIPDEVVAVHGITNEMAAEGAPVQEVLLAFMKDLMMCDTVVGHNVLFDVHVVAAECVRYKFGNPFLGKDIYDTMLDGTDFCKLVTPGKPGYKWPKLQELHLALFGTNIIQRHTALSDVEDTLDCFVEMERRGIEFHKIEINKIA